jgi:coenzyme F420 hydrogenase subunit beta
MLREEMPYGILKGKVVNNKLCCGCGTCIGVCPTSALTIDIHAYHEPVVDEAKCTSCGDCLAVCPGQGYPVVQWAKHRCEGDTSMLPDSGPVRKYLKGHSTDPDIHLNSSSGGIATALLLHLLETRQVDEVAVVGMENERPVALLTSDPLVVRDAAMSKYGPVPMLATLIPELRTRPRRLAMTVTACQLGGWTRATELIPKLRESAILTIGLFCGYVQSYDALTSIAATLGVRYPGEAKFVAWRYGPYPGSARFERTDGSAIEKPLYPMYDIAVPHFSLNRCFLCPDGGNWLADMTLGDIHSGGVDETIVVCRTRRGQEALESARKANKIAMEKLMPSQVETCVISGITRSKLLPAIACNAWLKKKGAAAPEFDYDSTALLQGKPKIIWIWKYRVTFWARSGWRRRFLIKHPAWLEKIGHFLYLFPETIPGFFLVAGARKLFIQALRNINRK